MEMQNVLLTTDGSWENTSLVNPDYSNGENGIDAVKIYIRLKVLRDFLDRVTEVAVEAYGILTEQPDERLPLFPGTFEIDLSGKSLIVQNKNGLYDANLQQTSCDPNTWWIHSKSLDTFDDPVADYCNRVGYFEENLFPILDELLIVFDAEKDAKFVTISLFKGRLIGKDEVTKIPLLTS